METQLSLADHPGKFIARLIRNFFTPYESWGRQNRNQFLIGLLSTFVYLLTNFVFKINLAGWNPFINSSGGLIVSVYICIALTILKILIDVINPNPLKYPWYENYMPMIITLLGLATLIAFQNLDGSGFDDAGLWINIVILLIVFILAAGYFVEGNNNEKIIKIWFALLGYYFSVITFFYFFEKMVN